MEGDWTARFWSKVNKTETCWLWTACTVSGYGHFWFNGKPRPAHRLSYEIQIGAIPDGLYLDHTCFNRGCVRPDHLRLVTPKQNRENVHVTRARSGYRGVVWDESAGRWRVRVEHFGNVTYGGYFTDPHEAASVAREIRNSLYTHNDLDRQSALATVGVKA